MAEWTEHDHSEPGSCEHCDLPPLYLCGTRKVVKHHSRYAVCCATCDKVKLTFASLGAAIGYATDNSARGCKCSSSD